MRRGFTLVECMVAGAVLSLSALILVQGVGVASRVAHENAEVLAAESIAWDAAWIRFNERNDENKSDSLLVESGRWQDLSEKAAPQLYGYDTPPKIKIDVALVDDPGWRVDLKEIHVDLQWGASGHRFMLSESGHDVWLRRSMFGRAP